MAEVKKEAVPEEVTLYTEINNALSELIEEIVSHDFVYAPIAAQKLHKKLVAWATPRGRDYRQFDKDFTSLFYNLKKNLHPMYRNKQADDCMKRVDNIVEKMSRIGLLYGQPTQVSTNREDNIAAIRILIENINNTATHLIQYQMAGSAQEISETLKSMGEHVDAITPKSDASATLQDEVKKAIGEMRARLLTVLKTGEQRAGQRAIDGYVNAQSELMCALEEFLSTLDNEDRAKEYACVGRKPKEKTEPSELLKMLQSDEGQAIIDALVDKKLASSP